MIFRVLFESASFDLYRALSSNDEINVWSHIEMTLKLYKIERRTFKKKSEYKIRSEQKSEKKY